jgi:ribonuclease BN (tRNA processing enzyme)
MELTVLGCAGTYPGPHSGCSSYLLEHDGFRLLLDAGNFATGALQRHGELFDVDAVLVSHLHADHCIDLVAYAYARKYAPQGPPPLLPVYGPPGTQDRICGAFDHLPPGELTDVYDWREVNPGRLDLGPFTVDLATTAHPIQCHAARLSAGGRTLTYSADTGPCPGLIDLARGSDVFLCEASWQDDGQPLPDGVHLTGRGAAEHAAKADVGKLLLTHLVPWVDSDRVLSDAAGVFADVAIARADASYTV